MQILPACFTQAQIWWYQVERNNLFLNVLFLNHFAKESQFCLED